MARNSNASRGDYEFLTPASGPCKGMGVNLPAVFINCLGDFPMKILSALALTALLGTSAAFAANTAGSASTSGAAAAAPAASTAATHMSSKACNKQADEKKLTGEARTSYVKDCRAGKAAK
jgi:hypothetical protein